MKRTKTIVLTPAQKRFVNDFADRGAYLKLACQLIDGCIVFRTYSGRTNHILTMGAYVLTGKQYLDYINI